MTKNQKIESNLTVFTSVQFDNSYASLPEHFYSRVEPVPVKSELMMANYSLARELGFDTEDLERDESIAVFSGNKVPTGASPIAMAYAGHQFGNFVPQLGDGRAVILGEIIDLAGNRRDIQLKGSGQTKFSRRGDGRSPLGPVIREYIVSEAMHALGIPSTRSLSVVSTGETVFRETPLPGGVLTRVASSHIRVGTFEYFAVRDDQEAIKLLADYVIERHYPQVKEAGNPYLALLQEIIKKQSQLISKWMQVGFIHGVMNTDNMTVSGETLDYGPCAFMDHYDPSTVFSAIDRQGRYAYKNQSLIAQWNLARLAETLLSLIHRDRDTAIKLASEAVEGFTDFFQEDYLKGMCKKLGFEKALEKDKELVECLLSLMQQNKADYTLTFRALTELAGKENMNDSLHNLLGKSKAVQDWFNRWQLRLTEDGQTYSEQSESMKKTNPLYIPRNHRVEEVITAAVQNKDYSPMREFNQVLQTPYTEQSEFLDYSLPPEPEEQVKQTFCGT